ncbi:hypothetical protein AAGG52_16445 [Bacillus licheniformis]
MSLPLDYQLLIDKRTGIINGLQKVDIEPVLPRKAVSWRAQVTNGKILANIPSDRIAGALIFPMIKQGMQQSGKRLSDIPEITKEGHLFEAPIRS